MSVDKITIGKIFNELDLSEAAAHTYIALLELDSISIRKISAHTGINRGTTYEILKVLLKHGLANVHTSGKREYYFAESPEKIFDLIREKRKELLQIQKMADDIVPKLRADSMRSDGRPIVKYFENDDGIVTILKDVLQTTSKLDNPEYYVYSSRPLRQYIYRKFPTFTDRRVDEGICVKVIAIGEGGDPAAVAERKWLTEPSEVHASSYTIIYGNKVAQISISTDLTPYGVVTEDAGAASMQRLLFDRLWQTL